MNSLIKKIASLVGKLCSIAVPGAMLDACETPKLYGPPPEMNRNTDFNQPFYEQNMKDPEDHNTKDPEKKDVRIANEKTDQDSID